MQAQVIPVLDAESGPGPSPKPRAARLAAVPLQSLEGPRLDMMRCEPVRRRGRIGDAQAEIRCFDAQRAIQLRHSASQIVCLVALDGCAEIVSQSGVIHLQSDLAVLVTREEAVTAVWGAQSRELLLSLPRARLQILASAAFGGARRLSPCAPRALSMTPASDLGRALDEVQTRLINDRDAVGGLGAPARALEDAVMRGVLEAVRQAGAIDEVFPLVRSVTEAMRRVEEAPYAPWSLAQLAMGSQVTIPVLRRGFRTHLGKSIHTFIQEVRLEGARKSLSSGHDSRPMSQVASSVGFASPNTFSRAYSRLYGEPPGETRARAVRALGNPESERSQRP